MPLTNLVQPLRSVKAGLRLTPKQSNIFQWGWQPEARFRTAVCGRRFGKTFLAAAEMRRAVRLAVEQGVSTDDEIWYGAPTFKQAKRVFWSRLKRAIPRSWIASKPNETECSITLKTGHVMRIVGLDNYEALRGSGLWFFLGDEWADADPRCWDEVVRPMLSTSGGHALFIGTPKGFNHFYDGYIAGQGDAGDAKSWLYTTLQGGNVPPAEVEKARSTLDPRSFRQEYEATFETFGGRVYYAFSRIESVRDCPYNASLPVHVGMDFNVNPMTATVWQEQPGGDIWQVGELSIPSSNTDEMADELIRRYGRASFDPTRPGLDHITIYPDPAGAQRRTSAQGKTDISILREKGFKVLAMSSHPLVRDRLNHVNAKFQTADGKRHAFVDPSCKRSIETYERLIFKPGTSEPDKDQTYISDPEASLDHLGDATGYYIFARFGAKASQSVQINHMGR